MMLQWFDKGLDLEFEENRANVLVIENGEDYSKFLEGLAIALECEQDNFLLYENDKKLNISKSIEIIFSPILLNVNSKRIQTHLFQELKKISDDEFFELKEEVNSVMIAYLDELSKKVSYPIKFDLELDENALYKQYNLHLDFEDESCVEKTINYIRLQSSLCGIKLFVLVNCKAYFAPEQLHELYKATLYNKVNILMVESMENYCVPEEKYYIIDQDHCLIMHD